jgi:hypothetical protein
MAEGRIAADSLVWREGWRDWQTAGKVFPQLSPPPPTAGLEAEAPQLSVTPFRSNVATDHRRTRANTVRIVVIGLLTLAIIALFFTLFAVFPKK